MRKLILIALLFCAFLIAACSSDDQDNLTSCADRIEQSEMAILALVEANEDNYSRLCVELRTALQVRIDSCGDQDGLLQDTINDLEDCTNDDVVTGD